MEYKYKKLAYELKKLAHTQDNKVGNSIKFHTRLINKTNITFSNVEIALFNTGLKKKTWIIVLEAERPLRSCLY